MQLEEGKFYRSRGGRKVGPMNRKGHCWRDEISNRYQEDGRYHAWSASSYDLIEEWEEPAALPPATEADGGWGPWRDGVPRADYQNAYDYREERISGVWRWQSRPQKPVVKKLERVVGTPTVMSIASVGGAVVTGKLK
jgi:hypothetical protein